MTAAPLRTLPSTNPLCAFATAPANLFFCEARNHTVRRVDAATGAIATVVGKGRPGYDGDGGPATDSALNEPYSLAVADDGSIYIVDRLNAVVRRVDSATGVISTVAGTGEPGYAGDGGRGRRAQLREPNDCFLDNRGGLLIADIQDQRIPPSGPGHRHRRHLRRQRGKSPRRRRYARPAGQHPGRPRRLPGRPRKHLHSRAGRQRRARGYRRRDYGHSGRGRRRPRLLRATAAPALAAAWGAPKAIRCDAAGNVIVVDTENHAIRRIDAGNGLVTTIAGGQRGAHGDGGPAVNAGLDRPHGCAVAADGRIYIADSNNHRVRVVEP